MMESAFACSSIAPEMELIYSEVVDGIRKQCERLEWSDFKLNFYRAITKELAQKYIQFLTDEQKETVLTLKGIINEWDAVRLPRQPNLTHVAQAIIYHAQLAEGKVCKKGKKRPKHKKLAAAQLREKGFFQSFNQLMNQWQEGAEIRCNLATEVDAFIEKLHSIVSMLDNRFHHNLERFFCEGPEGAIARRMPPSTYTAADLKAFPGDKDKKDKKGGKVPPPATTDEKDPTHSSTANELRSDDEDGLEWDERDETDEQTWSVEIKNKNDQDDDKNVEESLKKGFTIGDRIVVHWNDSRDIGTQTDYFDYKCLKDLDPSIKQFEESESEGDYQDTSDSDDDDED